MRLLFVDSKATAPLCTCTTDDVVQLICEHPNTDLQPRRWRHEPVPVWGGTRGRQNCDGSRIHNADRLPISPASWRQAGTGPFDRTNQENRLEQHHEQEEKIGQQRVAAIKTETDKLTQLLQSNTDLTREDKSSRSRSRSSLGRSMDC
jgi:hypothetical protein